MFLNPLFYWFFLVTLIASRRRIKQERIDFTYKVFPLFEEWFREKRYGVIYGFILSILLLLLGVSLPPIMLAGIVFFTMLYTLRGRFNFLFSTYIFGSTALVLFFLPLYLDYLPSLIQQTPQPLDWVVFVSLMGIFTFVEVLMLKRVQNNNTFPEKYLGKRGKQIGGHRLKKITMVPLMFFFPIGELEVFFEYWPILQVGGESYGFILFPFIIGFEYFLQTERPEAFVKRLSKVLVSIALITIILGVIGYFLPAFTLVAILFIMIAREILHYKISSHEQQNQSIYSPVTKGAKVLAVHPYSPASEMGIEIGEVITKVNGMRIETASDFYEALQINLAFSKLEVLDENGEVRFTQRAYFDGDHHQLGLVFIS